MMKQKIIEKVCIEHQNEVSGLQNHDEHLVQEEFAKESGTSCCFM
ncbi:hypothetical protein ALPO108162_01765 [Alicyclobacillus pomorum]